MKGILYLFSFMTCVLLFSCSTPIEAQDTEPLLGKWDLTMTHGDYVYPSWLEVKNSGHHTLVGRFVHNGGSARPISEVKKLNDKYSFSIPIQWESKGQDLTFEFEVVNDQLVGSLITANGDKHSLKGKKAPKLPFVENPKWGPPIELFNGKDLSGWHTKGENQWIVESGILKSPKPGSNLISDQKFMDFKIHAEFRYQKEGNSGIYLRGRYEVQIADNQGLEPSDIYFSGVYGFLTPNQMAAKAPGEWQTYDIILIGNRVTIIANGRAVIIDQTIPGITGGALDSDEGLPGSFFIQGDHGPIDFKSFIVTPRID